MNRVVSVVFVLLLVAAGNAKIVCESYCTPTRHDESPCHGDSREAPRLEAEECGNPSASNLYLLGNATRTSAPGGLLPVGSTNSHAELVRLSSHRTPIYQVPPDIGSSRSVVPLRI